MLDQYDRLKKRNAFLEQYKKEKNFELSEFDDARSVHSHMKPLSI
jgi:tubulin gamma